MPKVKGGGSKWGQDTLGIPGLNPESFNLPVYAGTEINLKVASFSEGNSKN